jgi:hypothetical protein
MLVVQMTDQHPRHRWGSERFSPVAEKRFGLVALRETGIDEGNRLRAPDDIDVRLRRADLSAADADAMNAGFDLGHDAPPESRRALARTALKLPQSQTRDNDT